VSNSDRWKSKARLRDWAASRPEVGSERGDCFGCTVSFPAGAAADPCGNEPSTGVGVPDRQVVRSQNRRGSNIRAVLLLQRSHRMATAEFGNPLTPVRQRSRALSSLSSWRTSSRGSSGLQNQRSMPPGPVFTPNRLGGVALTA